MVLGDSNTLWFKSSSLCVGLNHCLKENPHDEFEIRGISLCINDKIRIRAMATGTVKWFNSRKGFGFIQPDDGGADVFVHISAVQKAGLRSLNENDKISYELITEKGKTSAGNLQKA